MFHNKNKMLYSYEGADGVKTGFTKEAGRCLVSAAEREGMQLVCVVLNSPAMYERSAELLDGCFAGYTRTCLFDAETYTARVAAGHRGRVCSCSCRESFYYPLAEARQRIYGRRRASFRAFPCRFRRGKRRANCAFTLKISCFFHKKSLV